MKKFTAMFKARTMEFVRDRGTFFWNLLFPVVLVFGFAFAFSGDQNQLFKVGLIGSAPEPMPFLDIEQIEFVHYSIAAGSSIASETTDATATAVADQSPESGGRAQGEMVTTVEDRDVVIERLRQHQLDMVIDFTAEEYYINSQSANGPVLRLLFENQSGAPVVGSDPTVIDGGASTVRNAAQAVPSAATGRTAGAAWTSPSTPGPSQFTERQVSGEPIRYVDWLVPGVIGMNMMFSCLFGVGFVIVRYRKNGVLKRLKATPVSAMNFVSAQAASRLVIVLVTSAFVFAGTNVFLNFMMKGSYLNLLLLTALAIVSMISVGLVFASRLKSEELASGLMNLVTFPMLILSGVFFSLEGSPRILQQVSRALPLTHFISGARAIMLEGAGFVDIMPHVAFLAVLTVALLTLSAFLFRWE